MTELPPDGDHPTIWQSETASRPRVLYPILQSESDTILHVAAGIAQAIDAELVVGRADDDYSYETSRDVANTVFQAQTDPQVEVDVEGHTLGGSNQLEAIVDAATTDRINIVVMGDETSERLEKQIAERTGCDTVVVNDRAPLGSIASILVPVAGGPHSGAAVNVAGTLAEANGAWIELVHVLEDDDPEADRERAETMLESGQSQLPTGVDVDTRVIEAEDAVDAIVEESLCHDLTVIGAPRKGRLRRLIFGSTATELRDEARNTVVMARKGSDPDVSLFEDLLSG
jgi:nucleotide-binding universal stress UspA family protein